MKTISIRITDIMAQQMIDLAEDWGLPAVRHNTPVLERCVARVWEQEHGLHLDEAARAALQTLRRQLGPQGVSQLLTQVLEQAVAELHSTGSGSP